MVGREHWQTTQWGIVSEPMAYAGWAQSFVSIMTHETPMKVYRGRSYGLVFHIAPKYDFWKYFQVIGKGKGEGNIVGGPGDGGSHTPGGKKFRRSPASMGKDYEWFQSQKARILSEFNTVYHNQDYNEFIVNGLPSQSIAGVLHWQHGHTSEPTDREMCNFLCWRGGIRPWPIFKYSPGKLEVERYLSCVPDGSPAHEEYGCNKND